MTNKDILQFGFDIDGQVDKILEKRKTLALAITNKFKAEEEKEEREKLRQKSKKKNTKRIWSIEKDQRHETVLVRSGCW